MMDKYPDTLDLIELARAERDLRDSSRWREMAELYAEDAYVRISWFSGSAREFIEESRLHLGEPGRSVHQLGLPSVRIVGERALINTPCALYIDRTINGVDCELICLLNHQSRAARQGGAWRLHSLVAIYKKDFLLVRDPGQTLQVDLSELSGYRSSYRYLSLSRARGQVPAQDLPGVDRPDLVDALMEEDEAWLACG